MLLSRFKIFGHSMRPTYDEGDNVLVSSIPFFFSKPKKNDVVVFEMNRKIYIKRIGEISDKKYFMLGDNQRDSDDSRNFGLVYRQQIKGKVISKL